MPKSNKWSEDLLDLYFLNQDAPNIGDSAGLQGSSTTGSIYIALHTGDPTVTGVQGTNEASYNGYNRIATSRDSNYWRREEQVVLNIQSITFPENTGANSEVVSHLSLGDSNSVDTDIRYYLELASDLTVLTGMSPNILSGQLRIQEE